MINKIEKQVITHFIEYDDLLKNNKIAKRDNFVLVNGVGPKKDWNLADVDLAHVKGVAGNLVTEQSKKKSSKYRIILFVKSFATEPLCRFDSDGRSHENTLPFKSLGARKVETPHFHQYDKDGNSYAFKTRYLITNEKEVKENIQCGLTEMCTVYNIFTHEKKVPIIAGVGGLFPAEDLEDLHKEIYFPL